MIEWHDIFAILSINKGANMTQMDNTVSFIKTGEVYGKINCADFDTIIELREHFSFFADSYRFNPRFISHAWDGKIRLIDYNNLMRLGLHEQIKSYCERHHIPCKIDPKITRYNLDKESFIGWADKLDIHGGGNPITPYDYQIDATHHALEVQRCLLLSPTASGKSLMMYMLIRMFEKIMPNDTGLIVVPSVGLVMQLQKDFADYSSEVEWDAVEKVHGIRAGVCKETNKKIIVSTYQSLAKVPTDFFHQFKYVMVDEVHKATSKTIVRIIDNAINAKFRIGLTGTLDEIKTNEMILTGMFGPVYVVTTTKELMDSGQAAQLEVKVILLKHKVEDCKFLRMSARGPEDPITKKKKRVKASYAEEIQHIVCNDARNRYIMQFAAKLKGNTIIMVKEIEHGENLFKWMSEKYQDRDIYLYTGSTKYDEREKIRQIMEEKENAIIIGSIGCLSTGISIKRLHNLVFAHPSKSRVAVLQSTGRLLRLSKFGNVVTMYDIVDDFLIGAYSNYAYDHGQKRVSFYHQQQFKTETCEVKL